jgi:Mrp family chromosome partitioning ATPase
MVQLVERLFVMPQERGPVRLVLVSAVTRDADAERVSAWTAEMLASKNLGSVCLVDASVRSPNLHRDFSLPNQRGFAEFISDGVRNPRNIAYRIADSNFWVMPAGGNRGDQPIVTADHLNRCLQRLRAEFDFVIISAPVAVAQTAAMIIAPLTDGVVLVIEADRTRREVAWRTRHNFELAHARLLGVVLNNRKFPIPRTIYQRL